MHYKYFYRKFKYFIILYNSYNMRVAILIGGRFYTPSGNKNYTNHSYALYLYNYV